MLIWFPSWKRILHLPTVTVFRQDPILISKFKRNCTSTSTTTTSIPVLDNPPLKCFLWLLGGVHSEFPSESVANMSNRLWDDHKVSDQCFIRVVYGITINPPYVREIYHGSQLQGTTKLSKLQADNTCESAEWGWTSSFVSSLTHCP